MLRRTFMIALAAAALAAPAQAQLAGETLGLQYLFPDQSTTYQDVGTAVVGAGVEFSNVLGYYSLDITPSTLFIKFLQIGCAPNSCSWTATAFNGFRVYDAGGTAPNFTGFTVLSSQMVGLDDSRLSFDGNNLYVNWNGLYFHDGMEIELGVSAVPEPASMTLMATGLVGLVGAARRRRQARHAA